MRDRSMPRSPASRRASGVMNAPPASLGRPEIALGRAHFAEGIHAAQTASARLPSPFVPAQAGTPVRAGLWSPACAGVSGVVRPRLARLRPRAGRSPPPRRRPWPPRRPESGSRSACRPTVAGTSIEVLSVSISNRLSPGFTASPADLNHFAILPSATVSPSCGIRTSMSIAPLTSSPTRIASREIPSCLPCAPSRPRPDCLMPPNGAAGSDTSPRLRPIMPKSSFSETRMPRAQILGVEIGDQPVFGVVGALDRLVLGLEGLDRGDRPEDFLVQHLGVVRTRW